MDGQNSLLSQGSLWHNKVLTVILVTDLSIDAHLILMTLP